ncbi:MAG TPA: hypothetical protein VMH81_14435 [Bryobacteraceae bacterium]|nr:hypothetical protein [Bryobacteraceae bacterium]
MLLRQIALLSKSQHVLLPELTRAGEALERQVNRDLKPIWNVNATVEAFGSENDVPHGYWKITVLDAIPGGAVGGFHLDDDEQPYADVEWSPDWSLTASHECLEMLVDPFGRSLAAGPSPKEGQGRVTFLVEVCDPCEGPQCAYMIESAGGATLPVSDFCTPEYFAASRGTGVRYSFRGNLTGPLEVLDGGYLSWQIPADRHIWQLFGPAAGGNFLDNGPGKLTRESSDGFARQARSATAMEKREPGRQVPVKAPGQCNLTLDTLTGLLSGPSGAQTTVQIQDPSNAAVFTSISYDGTQIGSNVSRASFTIKDGQRDLSFAYNAPVPGDLVNLVDPSGAMLDVFANNPGNPTRLRRVIGTGGN